MKILHCVENYYPSIGGMAEVVRQISERLAVAGHEVTVATSFHTQRAGEKMKGVKIQQFGISGNTVEGIKGEDTEIKRYEHLLTESEFEIITNFAAQQWSLDLMLPVLSKIRAKKVMVPTGFSKLYEPRYNSYFERMKSLMKQYDMNVFLSENYRDINFARENGIEKIILIPNGASEDEFLSKENGIDIRKKLGICSNEFLILHVGAYTGFKGHKEALEIYLNSNIKNGILLLTGEKNNFLKRYFNSHYRFYFLKLLKMLNRKKIIFAELTRDETIASFKAADLFLFPSNIECSPLVLFESVAAGLPFLSTDAGNASEIIKWTGGGQILPTRIDEQGHSHARIRESSKLLNELYNDKARRKEMSEKGFNSWEKKFRWGIISKKYESVYKSLL